MNAVTTLGSSLDPTPEYTFDATTGELNVNKINLVPLQSQDFIYVVVGPVVNPADTEPSSTFTYLITDN